MQEHRSAPPHAQGSTARSKARPSLAAPGVVLGAGLGGFVDGIVLHQVLQWHHLLSSTDTDRAGIPYQPTNTVHGLEINTVADGLFHVATWLLVLVGMSMLFTRLPRQRPAWRQQEIWAWVLVGWGLFNVVEGTINHHLLGIHHVRSGDQRLLWDLSFLALGVLLIAVGALWARRARGTSDQWDETA